MNVCSFCNLESEKIENTIIDEIEDFVIIPSKGSLVDGYILVVPKIHVSSINELNDNQKETLLHVIKKYRRIFKKVYGRYPIVFEHGTGANKEGTSSSIVHAHIHIVNHNFIDEDNVVDVLHLEKVGVSKFYECNKKSYISYISQNLDYYISYDFSFCSQQMRKLIAKDLQIYDRYDWKKNNFEDNIKATIEKLNGNHFN